MISYLATKIKVFKKESHTSIKKVEESTLSTLVVDKLILVSSYETSHSQPKLWELINVVREQHCGTICGYTVFQQFPFGQNLFYRGTHGTYWNTTALYAKTYTTSDMFFV